MTALKEYIERTKLVLDLSSPQLNTIKDAEAYRLYLQNAFREIGAIGAENNRVLEECLSPLLEKGDNISEDEAEILRQFSAMLIDTTSMENLDLPLIYRLAEQILQHAEKSGDLKKEIQALDGMIIAAYMMVNLTVRLYPELDDFTRYRAVGLAAAKKMMSYLPPEQFETLPDDECRELVLINSRYIRCLFEWNDKEDRSFENDKDIELLKQSLALADDPYYREKMPNYRWEVHVFRTLQYLADYTEYNNMHEFDASQLRELNAYTKQLMAYLADHPEFEKGCPKIEQRLYTIRNAYLAGELPLEKYHEELCTIMQEKDANDFTARGMFVNFTAPIEYIMSLDADALSETQEAMLRTIYADIVAYTYHLPKTGVLSFMLTFLADLLRNYIKVPGGMSFEEICLKIMAAMHPPTYVHTLNIADITKYLAGCLLDRAPEHFVGICDTKDAAEVSARREEILDFAYHAALLHDIGKIFIVETIITYGRHLLESEFHLIDSHTLTGAALLASDEETAAYAEIAMGHHKWADDRRGYPRDFNLKKAKNRTLIQLVTAADCLDAATDAVGRSYKGGKTLAQTVKEFRAESGMHFAPFLVDLLEDSAVAADLQRIVTEGRDENYRKTYALLKSL